MVVHVPGIDALVRSFSEASSRRGLLRGVSAGALALAVTRLPGDAEAEKKRKKKRKKKTRADATCPGPTDDALSIVDVNARLAQTFTAIRSGRLVRAELHISEPNGSLGDYILRLSPVDVSDVPTNIVLAESQVLDLKVPIGQSTVVFPFAEPVSVKAGTTYALVLTRAGSDKLVWAGQMGNSCSGTAYHSPSSDAPFVAVGLVDLAFTTFVRSRAKK